MKNSTQKNFTTKTTSQQLVLPLNVEMLIPANDSGRLLSEIMDQLDYSALYKAYSRKGRKSAIESEENYSYLEECGLTGCIKPTNYEKAKTRKYRTNLHLLENMDYDATKDEYTCRNGKVVRLVAST